MALGEFHGLLLALGTVAVAGLAGISVPTDGEIIAEDQSVQHVVVRPEVQDALAQQPEAAVIISLREPQTARIPVDVAALKQRAAASQRRVLSTLAASDFAVTHQYEAVPALAGRGRYIVVGPV